MILLDLKGLGYHFDTMTTKESEQFQNYARKGYVTIRKQLDLSQAELADRLEVKKLTIIRRENGQTPISLEAWSALLMLKCLQNENMGKVQKFIIELEAQ